MKKDCRARKRYSSTERAEELAERSSRKRRPQTGILFGLDRVPRSIRTLRYGPLLDQRVTRCNRKSTKQTNSSKRTKQPRYSRTSFVVQKERIAGWKHTKNKRAEKATAPPTAADGHEGNQTLTAENKDFRTQLETQQREATALAIQHGALRMFSASVDSMCQTPDGHR